VRFLADENVERAVVEFLRSKGYEVFYVAETSPSISDTVVLEYAKTNGMIVITNDKDFGEMLYLNKKISAGILLIRSKIETAQAKVELVKVALERAGDKIRGHFVVVSERGIRIRPL